MMHIRNIRPKKVAEILGTYEKDKRIKKYADLMEEKVRGFGNSGGRYRMYTRKEVVVLQYIFKRVAEGVNLSQVIDEAVAVFYESTVVVFG